MTTDSPETTLKAIIVVIEIEVIFYCFLTLVINVI